MPSRPRFDSQHFQEILLLMLPRELSTARIAFTVDREKKLFSRRKPSSADQYCKKTEFYNIGPRFFPILYERVFVYVNFFGLVIHHWSRGHVIVARPITTFKSLAKILEEKNGSTKKLWHNGKKSWHGLAPDPIKLRHKIGHNHKIGSSSIAVGTWIGFCYYEIKLCYSNGCLINYLTRTRPNTAIIGPITQ